MNNDDGARAYEKFWITILVGYVAVVVYLGVAAVVHSISKTCDSYAQEASYFGLLLLWIFKFLIIGVAFVGTIYLAFKYFKVIKEITDIRDEFQSTREGLWHCLKQYCHTSYTNMNYDFKSLEHNLLNKIETYLKPPTPIPVTPTPVEALAGVDDDDEEDSYEDSNENDVTAASERRTYDDKVENFFKDLNITNPY